MARFVFELQAVLEDRERREQARRRLVGELEARRTAIEARVRQVQEAAGTQRESLRELVGGGGAGDGTMEAAGGRRVAVDRVRMQATASLHAVVTLQRAAIELAGVERRLGAARAELLAATVARKAVEALRARRFAAWRREEQRRENSALDDLNVMRAGRGAGDLGGEA